MALSSTNLSLVATRFGSTAVHYASEQDKQNQLILDIDLADDEIFVLLESNAVTLSRSLPPAKLSHYLRGRRLDEFQQLKESLVNLVSGSLLNEPRFYKVNDTTRIALSELVELVAAQEPEFILKLALYCRDDLGIRTTANYLLALAANIPSCRPFLAKYFNASTRLPSDWMEVAELYRTFELNGDPFARPLSNRPSFPAALRRVMMSKFGEFDEYQLAKYNKDKLSTEAKSKKKQKKQEKNQSTKGRAGLGADTNAAKAAAPSNDLSESEADEEGDDEATKQVVDGSNAERRLVTKEDFRCTIKYLIRVLHISDPVLHAMAILGKSYPKTRDDFFKSRLPGEWDETKAGKRMKLATPETWETEVSLKGNKATTWESLLDHKKLPFMAMMRNLRNMLIANMDDKHHTAVVKRLSSETQVVNSRQFPSRFLSAYEALKQAVEDARKARDRKKDDQIEQPESSNSQVERGGRGGRGGRSGRGGSRGSRGRGGAGAGAGPATTATSDRGSDRGRGRGRDNANKRGGRGGKTKGGQVVQRKDVDLPENPWVSKYLQSLETAIVLATRYNIKPIRGRTVLLVNVSEEMNRPCSSAKGLGKPMTLQAVGLLLGLMCKFSCEDCEFVMFDENGAFLVVQPNTTGTTESISILGNISKLEALSETVRNQSVPLSEVASSSAIASKAQSLGEYFETLLLERIIVDNVVVVTNHGEITGASNNGTPAQRVMAFVRQYRLLARPQLLFVNIDLGGSIVGVSHEQTDTRHPNDIYVSGYSDQILRFIADRGDGQQMAYINTIDIAKKLDIRPKKDLPRKQRSSLIGRPVKAIKDNKEKTNGDGRTNKTFTFYNAISPPTMPIEKLSLSLIPTEWRTARVFISSTFIDMHSERDVLVKVVFPQLRERCRQYQINLHEVDLRWGITQGESESSRSLQLCLEEIDRCRPFFVGLLGDRYGYVPAAYSTVDHFASFEWLQNYPAGRSITELEFIYGALDSLKLVGNQSFAVFGLRDSSFVQDMPDSAKTKFVSKHQQEITQLRSRVRQYASVFSDTCKLVEYKAKWGGLNNDGSVVLTGLEHFQTMMIESLWAAIQREFKLPSAALIVDDGVSNDEASTKKVLMEQQALQKYAVDHAVYGVVGRVSLMKRLFEFVDSDVQRNPLVVCGKPGFGKTAALAKFVKLYANSPKHLANNLLTHFVGISKESMDLRLILWRLCHEIIARFPIPKDTNVPEDFDALAKVFPELIRKACVYDRLVLVIDGLDNLLDDYGALGLQWLQFIRSLPSERVRVIISVSEKGQAEKSLRRWSPEPKQVAVGPLDPPEKALLVRQTLSIYSKKLDESPFNNQMRMLLSKREAGNPLFLQLACQDLRLFGVFEQMNNRLRDLASSVIDLIASMLTQMENDVGMVLIERALGLLSVCRNGLLESELAVLLRRRDEDCLPQALWMSLFANLKTFLRVVTTADNKLQLIHHDTVVSVRQRYLQSVDDILHLHSILAGFFLSQANLEGHRIGTSGNGSGPLINRRALSEVSYHLAAAGRWSELSSLLTDLVFVELRCRVGQVHELLLDYDHLLGNRNVHKHVQLGKLQLFRHFVSTKLHILHVHPVLLLQEALNSPHSAIYTNARALQSLRANTGSLAGSYVESLVCAQEQDSDAALMTLLQQAEPVHAVASTPDGSLIAAGLAEGSCRVFSVSNGDEKAVLRGHGQPVTALLFLDSSRVVVGEADGGLRVWDVSKNTMLVELRGHTRRVSALVRVLNNTMIASASWDCTVFFWNAVTGEQLNTLHGLPSPVSCMDVHPEGQQIVFGFWNGTLHVYDVLHRRNLFKLERHRSSVRSVAFAPSGRHIVSGCSNGTIKVWSMLSGKQVGSFVAHAGPVNGLTFSPSGDQLRSVGQDGQTRVWLGHLGVLKHVLSTPEKSQCRAVAVSSDQELIATGHGDGSIKLFTVSDGKLVANIERVHQSSINSVQWSKRANSRQIVTASDDSTSIIFELPTADSKQARLRQKNAYEFQGRHVKLEGHNDTVNYAAFGDNDRIVATASNDTTVVVFWASSGAVIETLRGHAGFVTSVAFSPDNSCLVSVSRDFSAIVWSADFKPLQTLVNCHPDWINAVALDISSFFTASSDFTLKQWSLPKPSQELRRFTGHMGLVTSLAQSSGFLLSGSSDNVAKVWSLDGSEVTTLHGHSLRVNCVDLSLQRDRKIAVTGSDDGTAYVWDPFQGALTRFVNAHSSDVTAVTSVGTSTFASSSIDGTVKLWSDSAVIPDSTKSQPRSITASKDVSSPNSVEFRHSAPITSVRLGEDGTLMASTARNGTVMLWQRVPKVADPICIASFTLPEGSGAANTVAFLPEPNVQRDPSIIRKFNIAVGANDGSITVWQGPLLRTSHDQAGQSGSLVPSLIMNIEKAHVTAVTAMVFVRSGMRLLSAGWDQRVRSFVWNGRMLVDDMDNMVLDEATIGLVSLPASSSNNVAIDLMAVSLGGSLRRLSVGRTSIKADSDTVSTLSPALAVFCAPAIAHLPPTTYVARADGTLAVFSTSSGQVLLEQCVHHGAANCVAVLGDGQSSPTVIVTGGSDGIVRLHAFKHSDTGSTDLALRVIGAYHLAGACTALIVSDLPSSSEFCAGDALGRLYWLRWNGLISR